MGGGDAKLGGKGGVGGRSDGGGRGGVGGRETPRGSSKGGRCDDGSGDSRPSGMVVTCADELVPSFAFAFGSSLSLSASVACKCKGCGEGCSESPRIGAGCAALRRRVTDD